jgi:DNA/RNA endonuclease YhcR with UshA esterase domain
VAFDGKRICVTGLIETYKGKPQIIARDPKQIVEAK